MTLDYLEFVENCFTDRFSMEMPIDDPKSQKEELNFRNEKIGEIKITSGLIGACDGFELDSYVHFDNKFPVGEFPVELSISNFQGDERIAFARILFSKSISKSVNLAVKSESYHEKDFFYVESGTACFFDIYAKNEIEKWINGKDDWYSQIETSMELVYKDTRSWFMFELENNNIPFFTSGQGDGRYKTYIVFDKKNEITQLITDFELFITNEE